MKSLLKYAILIIATIGIIVVVATGIMVLPVLGSYVRRTIYHLSRCKPSFKIGHAKLTTQSPTVSGQTTNGIEPLCTFLVSNISYLINISYACIAFYLAGLLPFFIKGKWGLDTAYLLLAISAVYLLAFHLPRIEYPNIHLSYIGTPDTDFCDMHCTCLQVKDRDIFQIDMNIANVGLVYYKNCSIWIHFPDDCIIRESNNECYASLSYRKTIQVQRGNNICLISPRDNDLSIAPFTSIRIPIWVHMTEYKKVKEATTIHVSVTSESTWGMATDYLELRVS